MLVWVVESGTFACIDGGDTVIVDATLTAVPKLCSGVSYMIS